MTVRGGGGATEHGAVARSRSRGVAAPLLQEHPRRAEESTAAGSRAASRDHAAAISPQRPAAEPAMQMRKGGYGGGGAAGDAPVPGAGRGGGAGGAQLPGTGLGGGGNRAAPTIMLREDALDWLKGNVNVGESSSCGIVSTTSSTDHHPDKSLKPPPNQKIWRPHNFLPFSEQELFDNNLDPQSPEIDALNDDLVLLYESISLVRKKTYEMMCKLSEANDVSSYGKEIGEELKRANRLIKDAEDMVDQIKVLRGEALPIPQQFYVNLKPLKA